MLQFPACKFGYAIGSALTNPNRRSKSGIVSPCAMIENATTAKVVTMTSSRCASVGGKESANANASAPRRPPHQSTC